MGVNVIYKTKATATGGRDGAARSEDGSVDVKLVVPKEMGGPGGDGANPEKLFAAGYSACFLGAMKAVSGKEGVKVRRTPPSPPRSASARVRKAAMASPSTCS